MAPSRKRSRKFVPLGLLLAPLVLVLAIQQLTRDEDMRPASASAEATATTAPDQSPPVNDERPIRTELELRWQPVRGATFYNVILWRDGGRALDLWPSEPAIDLSDKNVPHGKYRWFVYPALPTERGPRYGAVIAQGTVNI